MHGMFIATIKDWELIRVWRATSFKKRATEETEHELQASVDLDESRTRDMMCRGQKTSILGV